MSTPAAVGQNGDVYLFQIPDGGEIQIENGLVTMTAGLDNAAYLSLFGGNEDDDGIQGNKKQWWANLSEDDNSKKLRSETQFLLKSLPITSHNVLRLEDAALRDLEWFKTDNICNEITVVVTVPSLNKVNFEITLTAEGSESTFNFTENWRASL